jgi:hypothetical protein
MAHHSPGGSELGTKHFPVVLCEAIKDIITFFPSFHLIASGWLPLMTVEVRVCENGVLAGAARESCEVVVTLLGCVSPDPLKPTQGAPLIFLLSFFDELHWRSQLPILAGSRVIFLLKTGWSGSELGGRHSVHGAALAFLEI